MEKNKETRFVFLIEEERRAEAENDTTNVEAQHEAEARRAEEAQHEAEARRARESKTAWQEAEARRVEENETAQQEELFVLDYQGERAELEDVEETVPGDELQPVLEATGNIDLNDGPQQDVETRSEEGDNTVQQIEPNRKHPGDTLQADTPKRPKTEEETKSERGDATHSTEMKQEATTTRKTCDKGDSQELNHTATSRQGTE